MFRMGLNDKGKINENLPTQRDTVLVLRVYPYSNSFNISIYSDGCTIPNWDKSHLQPLELRQVCVGNQVRANNQEVGSAMIDLLHFKKKIHVCAKCIPYPKVSFVIK
jgi:hypothetical protein